MSALVRVDAVTPGMRIIRKRISGAQETVTVLAVRRMHEGGCTRYGFDITPHGEFLGWFTPAAPVQVED